MSEDLPEPLTPVITVSTLSGKVTSMPLRLFIRAPFNCIDWFHLRLDVGVSIFSAPVR